MNPATHRIVMFAVLLAAARAAALSAGEAPAAAAAPAPASASSPAAGASWQAPSGEQVRAQAMAWLEARGADEPAKQKAAELWASVPADAGELDVLAALSATVALVDENARALGTLCANPKSQLIVPSQPWLNDPATDPLVARNMRLLFGRWLVHEALFDEAVEQRYASWDAGIGKEVEKGKATLESLQKYIIKKGEAAPCASARQEYLENLFNRYC